MNLKISSDAWSGASVKGDKKKQLLQHFPTQFVFAGPSDGSTQALIHFMALVLAMAKLERARFAHGLSKALLYVVLVVRVVFPSLSRLHRNNADNPITLFSDKPQNTETGDYRTKDQRLLNNNKKTTETTQLSKYPIIFAQSINNTENGKRHYSFQNQEDRNQKDDQDAVCRTSNRGKSAVITYQAKQNEI